MSMTKCWLFCIQHLYCSFMQVNWPTGDSEEAISRLNNINIFHSCFKITSKLKYETYVLSYLEMTFQNATIWKKD